MSATSLRQAEAQLRDHALAKPEATEDSPWGHVAVKVRGKAFLFLGGEKDVEELSLSLKLVESHTAALDRPFAEPTGYGLGKHGWVSARFAPGDAVPLDLLRAWIDESYRAIAPKKLVAALDGGATTAKGSAATRRPAKKAGAKREVPSPGAKRGAAARRKPAAHKARPRAT